MTSTKKVRARIKPTSQVVKKNVGAGKTSTSKTKSVVKGSVVTKLLSSQTRSKTIKKAGQAGKKMKSPQKVVESANINETIGRTIKDKRKKHELSGDEYDAFVAKAAKKAKVSPEKLVTVDRRNAKPVVTGKLVAESDVKTDDIKERRKKIQRRRQIDPTTCERDYSQDEIEFMNALDEYKRNSGRMFPTCSEILEVFRGLGYTKQSHEESIENSANPESGDVFITVTETDTVRCDDYHNDEYAGNEEMA